MNATDGASVKAALLGRAYTNLGGFANLTTSEMTALTDSVADSAVTMSGDQVTAVDNFDAAGACGRDAGFRWPWGHHWRWVGADPDTDSR